MMRLGSDISVTHAGLYEIGSVCGKSSWLILKAVAPCQAVAPMLQSKLFLPHSPLKIANTVRGKPTFLANCEIILFGSVFLFASTKADMLWQSSISATVIF